MRGEQSGWLAPVCVKCAVCMREMWMYKSVAGAIFVTFKFHYLPVRNEVRAGIYPYSGANGPVLRLSEWACPMRPWYGDGPLRGGCYTWPVEFALIVSSRLRTLFHLRSSIHLSGSGHPVNRLLPRILADCTVYAQMNLGRNIVIILDVKLSLLSRSSWKIAQYYDVHNYTFAIIYIDMAYLCCEHVLEYWIFYYNSPVLFASKVRYDTKLSHSHLKAFPLAHSRRQTKSSAPHAHQRASIFVWSVVVNHT